VADAQPGKAAVTAARMISSRAMLAAVTGLFFFAEYSND